jgi:hypothetical protein
MSFGEVERQSILSFFLSFFLSKVRLASIAEGVIADRGTVQY